MRDGVRHVGTPRSMLLALVRGGLLRVPVRLRGVRGNERASVSGFDVEPHAGARERLAESARAIYETEGRTMNAVRRERERLASAQVRWDAREPRDVRGGMVGWMRCAAEARGWMRNPRETRRLACVRRALACLDFAREDRIVSRRLGFVLP